MSELLKKISEAYFRPKSFEKSGRVYEMLGIRRYKKIILGQVGRKREDELGGTNYYVGRDFSEKSLKEYELKARRNEKIHIGVFALCVSALGIPALAGAPEASVLAGLIASPFLVNELYLAMTQRYNRARIYSILERKEGRTINER